MNRRFCLTMFAISIAATIVELGCLAKLFWMDNGKAWQLAFVGALVCGMGGYAYYWFRKWRMAAV